MNYILNIFIIVLVMILIIFAILILSFFLMTRAFNIRELEAKKVIDKSNSSDPIYYDYEYFKKHLVEEERKAIESLHNSYFYQSLPDEEKQDEDKKLRFYLHTQREQIESMIQGKHDFIENPLNI